MQPRIDRGRSHIPCSTRLALLCALLLTITTSGTVSANTSVSISLTQTGLNPGEALLLGVVGSALNLDTDVLLSYKSETRTTKGAVSLAWTSKDTGVDTDILLTERQQGKSWEAISASRLPPGLRNKPDGHPGRANHLARIAQAAPAGADPYELSVSLRFLSEYYDADENRLIAWIELGLTLEDIALALNFGARQGVDPDRVIRLRLEGQSWETLVGRFGLTMTLLSEPVAKPQRSGGSPANQGKGKGKGKGGN